MERTPTFQVQHFGNYYLLERIAVGGMAEIFKAKQVGARGFEKIVVIKKILQHLSEDPQFVEMFEDEAKLAAQLNQANIVQIYELGEIDGTLYITMEYIDGKNLRDVTRAASGRGLHLSVDQCVHLISEVLKGLDYAHRKADANGMPLNIIHRDISPQNIIISYEGEVKILDFGIAKAASKISKTEAGVLKGKFSYMSPEQAAGKPIDQTSDIYAVGVILHEILTSERLFRSKSDMETLEKVKSGVVHPPSEKNPQIPPELDRIALKALAKDREHRYQTPGEMFQDLQKFSLEQQYTAGIQEISAFMKTLFADAIKEEKVRLAETLKRVPSSPHQELQNARTHITFKRDPQDIPKTTLQNKVDDPDITTTKDKPFLSTMIARPARLALFLVLILGIGAALLWRRLSDLPPPSEESAEAPTTTTVPKIEKAPIIPIPVPPPLDEKKVDNLLKREEENPGDTPQAPIEKKPEVVIERQSEEPPRKLELPKPRVVPKPTTTKPQEAPKAKETRAAMGRINVTAPPEGYAKLFVNDQAIGTVPGPKARNIEIPAGSVNIRCETSSKVYTGKVRVRANQTLTVKCQDLKG